MKLEEITITYPYQNPKTVLGNSVFLRDEIVNYQGRKLLIIRRLRNGEKNPSYLVYGFILNPVKTEDGTLKIIPVSTMERINVERYLRTKLKEKKDAASKETLYFINTELEVTPPRNSYNLQGNRMPSNF